MTIQGRLPHPIMSPLAMTNVVHHKLKYRLFCIFVLLSRKKEGGEEMDFFGWLLGSLGGLSAVVGIGNAFKIVPEFYGLAWTFWFALAVILLLAAIAFAIAGKPGAAP